VRKLKAKGKVTPEKTKLGLKHDETKQPQPEDHRSGEGSIDKEDDESRSGFEDEGLEDGAAVATTQEPGHEEIKDKDQASSQFSRRKLRSNAWRYEAEELEFPLVRDNDEDLDEEPEPDYVSLTRERKGQFEDLDGKKVETGIIDQEFLKDRERIQQGDAAQDSKGKVVKVDRQRFQEITNRISKQANVDAFKARFAPRKGTRAPERLYTGEEEDQDAPDLDAFLQDLDLNPEGKERNGGSISVSNSEWDSQDTNRMAKDDKDADDDWLDSMLERPRAR